MAGVQWETPAKAVVTKCALYRKLGDHVHPLRCASNEKDSVLPIPFHTTTVDVSYSEILGAHRNGATKVVATKVVALESLQIGQQCHLQFSSNAPAIL